ncbi:hypothetical protein [Patulibacter medicamentivorans]|jgi:hypothetical protein|uniref:hypothetical protein n=1 Tax=Patulibacter medicamentivorans TaxID=1097667 RepID=UPI00058E0532|nr:hypothetical protein [Patulibacter medicamentivorans]
MSSRRLIASLGLAATASVLLPAIAAGATISEVGEVKDGKAPRCPEACSVVTRTTGLPTSIAGDRNIFKIPSNGRVVAWTVTLGAPATKDRAALQKQLGRAKAQLVILRRGKSVAATVVGASSAKTLDPYFGGSVTFALPKSLAVRKGDVIGLSVPSWAPVLVQGYDANTSWRASRPRGRCGGTTDERKQDYYVDTTLAAGKSGTFNCLYKSERMAYSATFIPTPVPKKTTTR